MAHDKMDEFRRRVDNLPGMPICFVDIKYIGAVLPLYSIQDLQELIQVFKIMKEHGKAVVVQNYITKHAEMSGPERLALGHEQALVNIQEKNKNLFDQSGNVMN